MRTEAGVLALLTDPDIRGEVDRVAAAAGVDVVHLPPSGRVSPKIWMAAAVVLLDGDAAGRHGATDLPQRRAVFVLTGCPSDTATLRAALAVGARQVLEIPGQSDDLVRELSHADDGTTRDGAHGALIAVLGGRGGAGASTLAAAQARAAGSALLVDLDPWSGGLDLLLGLENRAGLRWPDLALQGGRLNWEALRAALPGDGQLRVLSAARSPHDPPAGAAAAVIGAGSRGGATVVCDLPRRLTDAAGTVLNTADLVVLITQSDVRSCAATGAIAPVITGRNPAVGLVVRGPSPGGLAAVDVAEIVGLPVLAAMRPEPMLAERLERGGLAVRRRSPLLSAARAVLALTSRGPLATGRVAV